MEEVLRYYMQRLTHLRGQAGMRVLKVAQGVRIDIHDLNQLLGKSSFSVIAELIKGEETVSIAPSIDKQDKESQRVSHQLRKLCRSERALYEERGVHALYVGWPFVEGQFQDGYLVRAPLLLFPVSLRLKNQVWTLDYSSPPIYNTSFLLAYFTHYALPFTTQEQAYWTLKNMSKEPIPFITQLYEKLRDSPLDISFTTAHFEQCLRPFLSYTRKELLVSAGPGQLRLKPEAVLGLFPHISSASIDDYKQLLRQASELDFSDFFPASSSSSSLLDDSEAYCAPLAMDDSQEQAFLRVREGESLVVQGPPGTGKSQLITNVISDALYRGKRVLFVAQKRAALSAVQKNISQIGVETFLAQVCDVQYDRPALYHQLIDQIETARHTYTPLSEEKKRRFAQLSAILHKQIASLRVLQKMLYDTSICGIPIKHLYLQSDPYAETIDLSRTYSSISFSALETWRERLVRFFTYRKQFASPHPWHNRRSFASYSPTIIPSIRQHIRVLQDFFGNFQHALSSYLPHPITFDDLEHLIKELPFLEEIITYLKDESLLYYTQKVLDTYQKDRAFASLFETFLLHKRTLLDVFSSIGPSTLPEHEVSLLLQHSARILNFRRYRLSWWLYRLFSREYPKISSLCKSLHLQERREDLLLLFTSLQKKQKLTTCYQQLQTIQGLLSLPHPEDPSEVWHTWLARQEKMFSLIQGYRNSKVRLVDIRKKEAPTYLQSLYALLSEAKEHLSSSQQYIHPSQQALLFKDLSFAEKMAHTLVRDFEDLYAFDQLQQSFSLEEKECCSALARLDVPDADPEALYTIFFNSWALKWIEHIEQAHPVLRSVSTSMFQEQMQTLLSCLLEREKLSEDVLKDTLFSSLHTSYDDSRPERPQATPHIYAKLLAQLEKKGGEWPIRRLVNTFDKLLFQLIPVWMCTPEAVSSIFPLKKMFDLVLFDEASQCFAEEALPVLYRGKQVVIVGDQKQLPPSDLYVIRTEEDVEDAQAKSLLSLSTQYVAQTMLCRHYRSRLPDLISFSNQHFYQGKLRCIPHYELLRNYSPSIHYIKMQGFWEDKRNPIEAKEVLKLILHTFHTHKDKTLGVVTFNYAQQELILQYIDEYRLKNPGKFENQWDSIFVKNIENVQGDERDIIIFSIGYAPRVGEKKVQHFFGLLNTVEGENRLNVAITRAKEALYVIASMYAEALQVSETKHRGPKLLKQYLQYAYRVSKNMTISIQDSSRSALYDLSAALQKRDHRSFTLRQSVDFASLIAYKENQPLFLLYTDDFDGDSVKDFFLYTPRLLSEKKWPYQIVYSRNFWLQKERATYELQKFYEKIAGTHST